MARYYVLDWDAKPTIVGHVADENTTSLANKYTRGRPLVPDRLPVNLKVHVDTRPEHDYPDYFTLQQIPVVSARFVTALRSAVNNVEVYPAPIVEGDRVVQNYHVLNVLGRVSCLDAAHSELTYIDEDTDIIFRVLRLAIDEKKAQELELFRLHEFELLVLVSERVRDALQGLSGVSLLPAQGWSDTAWF